MTPQDITALFWSISYSISVDKVSEGQCGIFCQQLQVRLERAIFFPDSVGIAKLRPRRTGLEASPQAPKGTIILYELVLCSVKKISRWKLQPWARGWMKCFTQHSGAQIRATVFKFLPKRQFWTDQPENRYIHASDTYLNVFKISSSLVANFGFAVYYRLSAYVPLLCYLSWRIIQKLAQIRNLPQILSTVQLVSDACICHFSSWYYWYCIGGSAVIQSP